MPEIKFSFTAEENGLIASALRAAGAIDAAKRAATGATSELSKQEVALAKLGKRMLELNASKDKLNKSVQVALNGSNAEASVKKLQDQIKKLDEQLAKIKRDVSIGKLELSTSSYNVGSSKGGHQYPGSDTSNFRTTNMGSYPNILINNTNGDNSKKENIKQGSKKANVGATNTTNPALAEAVLAGDAIVHHEEELKVDSEKSNKTKFDIRRGGSDNAKSRDDNYLSNAPSGSSSEWKLGLGAGSSRPKDMTGILSDYLKSEKIRISGVDNIPNWSLHEEKSNTKRFRSSNVIAAEEKERSDHSIDYEIKAPDWTTSAGAGGYSKPKTNFQTDNINAPNLTTGRLDWKPHHSDGRNGEFDNNAEDTTSKKGWFSEKSEHLKSMFSNLRSVSGKVDEGITRAGETGAESLKRTSEQAEKAGQNIESAGKNADGFSSAFARVGTFAAAYGVFNQAVSMQRKGLEEGGTDLEKQNKAQPVISGLGAMGEEGVKERIQKTQSETGLSAEDSASMVMSARQAGESFESMLDTAKKLAGTIDDPSGLYKKAVKMKLSDPTDTGFKDTRQVIESVLATKSTSGVMADETQILNGMQNIMSSMKIINAPAEQKVRYMAMASHMKNDPESAANVISHTVSSMSKWAGGSYIVPGDMDASVENFKKHIPYQDMFLDTSKAKDEEERKNIEQRKSRAVSMAGNNGVFSSPEAAEDFVRLYKEFKEPSEKINKSISGVFHQKEGDEGYIEKAANRRTSESEAGLESEKSKASLQGMKASTWGIDQKRFENMSSSIEAGSVKSGEGELAGTARKWLGQLSYQIHMMMGDGSKSSADSGIKTAAFWGHESKKEVSGIPTYEDDTSELGYDPGAYARYGVNKAYKGLKSIYGEENFVPGQNTELQNNMMAHYNNAADMKQEQPKAVVENTQAVTAQNDLLKTHIEVSHKLVEAVTLNTQETRRQTDTRVNIPTSSAEYQKAQAQKLQPTTWNNGGN